MSLRENFTCPTLAANVKGKPRLCQGTGKRPIEKPDCLLLADDSSKRAILPASGRHAARKRLSGAMQYTCGTLDGWIRLTLYALCIAPSIRSQAAALFSLALLRACRRSFVSQPVQLSEGSASEAADVETKRFGLSTGLSAAAERAFPEESALTRRDKGFLLSNLYGRGFSFLSWLFSSSAACLRSIASRSRLKWRSTTRRKPPSTI